MFLFHFLLHDALQLVGHDVAVLRALGLVGLSLAAWAANASLTSCLRANGVAVSKSWAVVSTGSVVATCTAAYVGAGRVPSYRIIVLFAMLLFVTGFVRWWGGGSPRWAGLVGAAGVLTFTGKPTSAAALAAVLLVTLVVARVRAGLSVIGWTVLGAAAMAGTVLIAARMTPVEVVSYLASGLEIESAAGSHSSWMAMLGFAPIPLGALLVLGPVLYAPLMPACHDAVRNQTSRWPAAAQLMVGLVAAFATAVLGIWLLSRNGFGVQVGELVFPWPLGAAVLVMLIHRRMPDDGLRRTATPVVVLLTLPYVAAIGTNTNFPLSMTQAAVFWALAVVGALSMAVTRWPRTDRLLLPTALLLATTALVMQVVWTADSLEGQEVYAASRATKVLGGDLVVRSDTAELLDDLSELSETYHLAGRPSVDLTGYGAGYQLVLGTRPLGRASFFGTFAGAERGAAVALSMESCEDLRSAVVLSADDNPLSVAAAAPLVGLDIDSGYRTIFRFHPTHGTDPIRRQSVSVLIPDPDVRTASTCAHQSARTETTADHP